MIRRFLYTLVAAILLPWLAASAPNATIVWEFRNGATANMVNGGGFKPGASGTDYSQQAAAQWHITTATSAGAGNLIYTTTATASMIGNIVHVISGTNFNAGWYEIVDATAGEVIELSTNKAGAGVTSGVGSDGDIYIGGSLSLNSTLDDDFFEQLVGGQTVYVASGSYSIGEAISIANAGTVDALINLVGYRDSRSTIATGTDRPTLAFAGTATTSGGYFSIRNFIITTGHGNGLVLGANNNLQNTKITNTVATALTTGAYCRVVNCEISASAGSAIVMNGGSLFAYGNYIHDSVTGIAFSTQDDGQVINNLIVNVSTGASFTTASIQHTFINNTFYGGSTPSSGNGLGMTATGTGNLLVYNNIITGFKAGVYSPATQGGVQTDYNNFYNNTTNRTNFAAGSNDMAVDPQFVSPSGGDYRIGKNLKGRGFPGTFNGLSTIGYTDPGAVQRKERGGGGVSRIP